jgi:hypothetical protein
MQLSFGIADWPHADGLDVEQQLSRLIRCFPAMLVDREKGNAWLQCKLDQLIAMGAPNIILTSHKALFDNVVFVSISEPAWSGVTATSYLESMVNASLSGVCFDVPDTAEPATVAKITQDLGNALHMLLCSEIDWDRGGRIGKNK